MLNLLHEYLVGIYGGGDVNRLAESTQPICVDDKGQDDHYHLFCRIHVQVLEDHNFELHLKYVPTSAAVLQLIQEVEGEVVDIGPHKDIRVNLHASDGQFLQRLAKAIKRVIGRGAHYDEKNWKWMCPRTAGSLEKLAAHLKRFDRMRRNGTLPKAQPPAPEPALTVVSPPVNVKSTRKVRKEAVKAQIEEDDEENLYKICGIG